MEWSSRCRRSDADVAVIREGDSCGVVVGEGEFAVAGRAILDLPDGAAEAGVREDDEGGDDAEREEEFNQRETTE